MLDRLFSGLTWVAALAFVAAGIMLSYEVVARYFFTRPTIWAAELSQLCLIWGSLLGMPWLLQQQRHIRITALLNLLNARGRHTLALLEMTVVALFSLVVVRFGGQIFLDSFERGRTTGSLLDLPAWIAELAVPLGFALLAIEALRQLYRLLTGASIDGTTS